MFPANHRCWLNNKPFCAGELDVTADRVSEASAAMRSTPRCSFAYISSRDPKETRAFVVLRSGFHYIFLSFSFVLVIFRCFSTSVKRFLCKRHVDQQKHSVFARSVKSLCLAIKNEILRKRTTGSIEIWLKFCNMDITNRISWVI